MPTDCTAAYYNPQLKIKVKAEDTQYRVRGTIGGDKVHYPGVTTAYTAHLETIRVMLNAIVSEDAERHCSAQRISKISTSAHHLIEKNTCAFL